MLTGETWLQIGIDTNNIDINNNNITMIIIDR